MFSMICFISPISRHCATQLMIYESTLSPMNFPDDNPLVGASTPGTFKVSDSQGADICDMLAGASRGPRLIVGEPVSNHDSRREEA
jgi:hypothetical protein